MLQGKDTANEATDRFVRTFHVWCLCRSADLHTFGFTTWEFSVVGSYTENPEKPQNCQNWGVGACTGMGACSGQYGTSHHNLKVTSMNQWHIIIISPYHAKLLSQALTYAWAACLFSKFTKQASYDQATDHKVTAWCVLCIVSNDVCTWACIKWLHTELHFLGPCLVRLGCGTATVELHYCKRLFYVATLVVILNSGSKFWSSLWAYNFQVTCILSMKKNTENTKFSFVVTTACQVI